ncbi:DJ-1/PfpI family protein [Mycobacterium sp. 852014-52450_SCH5900713]|uniref:DJ-1/PfpI family protein n=1 Tax=Mycobacterium sp. 852014-52450_SCH5900713 TaxID=1834116 RepID=UPI0009EE1056
MRHALGAGTANPHTWRSHGPSALASAGLLDGRTLTSWPGIRDDLVKVGATWLDREAVRDRNLVPSRAPQNTPSSWPTGRITIRSTRTRMRAATVSSKHHACWAAARVLV